MIKEELYELAHEVKNPLSIVKGYLSMMNSSNYIKYKSIIDNELNNTLEVLNAYLECNKLTSIKEVMDINLLLEEIRNDLKDYLIFHNVYLNLDINDEVYLLGDYNRLREVFINLIKNSIEARNSDLIINISTKVVDNKIIITFIDNGLGMSTETLEKIGSNYTTKAFGNGIGTTLSRKIIAAHNGTITYYSKQGDGTKIVIELLLFK